MRKPVACIATTKLQYLSFIPDNTGWIILLEKAIHCRIPFIIEHINGANVDIEILQCCVAFSIFVTAKFMLRLSVWPLATAYIYNTHPK